MNRIYKRAILILIIIFACPVVCRGAWIWTPENNRWLNPKGAVKDTAEEQLRWAMDFYESKNHKRAVAEFNKLVDYYPNSKI